MWGEERELVGKGVEGRGEERGKGSRAWLELSQNQSQTWWGQKQETLKREPPGKCGQPSGPV